jgi:hypothetical protein
LLSPSYDGIHIILNLCIIEKVEDKDHFAGHIVQYNVISLPRILQISSKLLRGTILGKATIGSNSDDSTLKQ